MTRNEISSILFGSKVSHFDDWYKETTSITITHVDFGTNSVMVCDDNDRNVSIPMSILDALIGEGRATRAYTIDHCTIEDEFRLEITAPEEVKQECARKDAPEVDIFASVSSETLDALVRAMHQFSNELKEKYNLSTLVLKTGSDYEHFWETENRAIAQTLRNARKEMLRHV